MFDDEDEHIITTGAVVTLVVHLERENMSSLFNKDFTGNSISTVNAGEEDVNDENAEDKENRNKAQEALKTSSKTWQSKSDKKKKSNKDKGKKKGTSSKVTVQKPAASQPTVVKTPSKEDDAESSDDNSSKHSDESPSTLRQRRPGAANSKGDSNESENENNEDEATPKMSKKTEKSDDNDDDTFLERFQQQQRKREKLETRAKISHRVFCPFYPEIKQECWWLYVADRKHRSLISAPVYLCTLKDKEEVEVKFSAPKEPGHYVYSVTLRSDSYFDVDVTENLAFDVQEAKEITEDHPQWNFGEDEASDQNKADDEEYATESDSD